MAKTKIENPAPTSERKTLSEDARKGIHEIGVRFARFGWDRSDANASAEQCAKIEPRLVGTGRALVVAIRAPFGAPDGSLASNGTYAESKRLFATLSPDAMGAHFVRAVESVLNGETLTAALPGRTPGVRKGTL
jgi:hypothetical protein